MSKVAGVLSKGSEAPPTLPGPPRRWASAAPVPRMAGQVRARRARCPVKMRELWWWLFGSNLAGVGSKGSEARCVRACTGPLGALRNVKTKVRGQELRLVLLCSSHESSGPKLLAVQLPHKRLHFCMAVLNRASQYPQNGESGDGWSCGHG